MKKPVKRPEVSTTGHEWDGIQELNNPLPRWWLWTLYATIIWGVGYVIAYPAWPMLTGATQGVIGWSARDEVAQDIAAFDAANAAIKARLVAADLTQIGAEADLAAFAQNAGAAVFRTNCATCHGAGAAGVVGKGYPNLLDDDWLWGGDIDAILTTITHGIRNTQDPDARWSQMPAFGVDGILEGPQIAAAVEHVLAISGAEHDAALATEGAVVFAENCAICHGDAGAGDRDQCRRLHGGVLRTVGPDHHPPGPATTRRASAVVWPDRPRNRAATPGPRRRPSARRRRNRPQ